MKNLSEDRAKIRKISKSVCRNNSIKNDNFDNYTYNEEKIHSYRKIKRNEESSFIGGMNKTNENVNFNDNYTNDSIDENEKGNLIFLSI